MQFGEQAEDILGGGGIQVSGGLVGEDHRRLRHQCPGDGHALLLATGELTRSVVDAVTEPDSAQRLDGARLALLRCDARVQHGQLDVAPCRQRGQQVELLEDEPDLLVAHHGKLGLGHVRDVGAGETVGARGRGVEAADDVHQRRLARARRAGDGDELALVDLEGDTAHGLEGDRSAGVALADAVQGKDRRVHRVPPVVAPPPKNCAPPPGTAPVGSALDDHPAAGELAPRRKLEGALAAVAVATVRRARALADRGAGDLDLVAVDEPGLDLRRQAVGGADDDLDGLLLRVDDLGDDGLAVLLADRVGGDGQHVRYGLGDDRDRRARAGVQPLRVTGDLDGHREARGGTRRARGDHADGADSAEDLVGDAGQADPRLLVLGDLVQVRAAHGGVDRPGLRAHQSDRAARAPRAAASTGGTGSGRPC